MQDMVVNVWRALWYNNIHFLLPKCMLVQVKLLYNILSETKYTMHLFQLCPLCACRLLPTRCWCCWKTAIRLNNTRQQLCYMYILYIYYLHILCIYIWLYMYVCCRIKFDLIWFAQINAVVMLDSISNIAPDIAPGLSLLLRGDINLTFDQNEAIFEYVQAFIRTSSRFWTWPATLHERTNNWSEC